MELATTPPPGSGGTSDSTTPTSKPLMPVSHNLRPDAPLGQRDSSVHDKINQFNSLAMQSKQLERKTADAALKRAMLGREQAETEMRQYRDEARLLRKHIDEGKQREQKVGERLETVMENYARAKETHAHTQALWEKEIRRARKETFKSQSSLVKLQEELKTSRAAQKAAEDLLGEEKERSKAREQESFAARYTLVGVQEKLEQALERIRLLEQERDAFKSLAKSEEDVARIAAEGKLPLPSSSASPEDDEFASPKKKRSSSAASVDVKASAAGEAEMEELTRLWQWEQRRANRALDHVDFLEAEGRIITRPVAETSTSRTKPDSAPSPQRKRTSPAKIADASDLVILKESAPANRAPAAAASSPKRSKTEMLKGSRPPLLSPVFVPSEGIFRTVSQEQAEAMEAAQSPTAPEPEPEEATEESSVDDSDAPSSPSSNDCAVEHHPKYARTPSLDPPSFAIPAGCRTSLLSLLDAPHQEESDAPIFNIPTQPAEPVVVDEQSDSEEDDTLTPQPSGTVLSDTEEDASREEQPPRPHTSAAFYEVKTTTVKVNMDSPQKPNLSARLMSLQRTPSQGSREKPSFDVTNPALTPTMTREQALAQIRERRGRARSVAQGAVTPRKQMLVGTAGERRDVSAPTGRVGAPVSVGRRVRS